MSECQVCGEKRKDRLVAHPRCSADRLCVDCRINWHEEEIESHEGDLKTLYLRQTTLEKKDASGVTETLDGRKPRRKDVTGKPCVHRGRPRDVGEVKP